MPILDISRLLLPLLALISPDLKIDIVHHALHSCLQTLHRWQFILPCSFNDWLHSKEQVLKYVMRCVATPPWVFFTFFKLYIWYQIAQRITCLSHRYLSIYLIVLDIISSKTCSIVFNNFFCFLCCECFELFICYVWFLLENHGIFSCSYLKWFASDIFSELFFYCEAAVFLFREYQLKKGLTEIKLKTFFTALPRQGPWLRVRSAVQFPW